MSQRINYYKAAPEATRVRKYFNEKQYVDLIIMINTINSWNRLSISMGNVPGSYEPAKKS